MVHVNCNRLKAPAPTADIEETGSSFQAADVVVNKVNIIKHIYNGESWSRKANALQAVAAALPDLLKASAFKLAHDNTEELHMSLAHRLYRSRSKITRAVIETFTEDEDTAIAGDIQETPDSMSVSDKLALWDRKEQYTEAPNRVPWDDGSDEDELVDFNQEFQEYRDVLLRSPAFSWLLNSVLNEINLSKAPDDFWHTAAGRAHSLIRAAIISHPGAAATVLSPGAPPPRQSMLFQAHWPEGFLLREYILPPHEVLDKVLVPTGVAEHSWATTTKQYLETAWPDFGPRVLDIYKALLEGQDVFEITLFDGTSICARPSKLRPKIAITDHGVVTVDEPLGHQIHMEVTVTGTVYSIAEVGEILGWIGAALSSSEADGTIGCLNPIGVIKQSSLGGESTPGWRWEFLPKKKLSPKSASQQIEDISALKGQCWTRLFGKPVLVDGYRIPRRDEPGTGMEVPLNIMAQLVNMRKISIFGGKILIKGYSTILAPTRKTGDCIFWHVVSNDDLRSDENYIPYSDPRVATLLQQYPSNLTLSDLETSRHILGWCGEVKNFTGK
ncbi:hypothetical protein OQA88_2535 [Cercophora sp. LCS_1]